jgi:hypothetical protein
MARSKLLLPALAVLVLLPSVLRAQAVSGASIAGTVKDSSGAVLPGVSVEASSPALIEKVRSVTTDASGQYKIENLRPGTYAVSFTLSGFSSVKREGVELSGTFVATVNADLMVGNVSETITVTTESPIVDIQSSQRQRVFSQDVLDAIPAGRSHINEIVLLPGVNAAQPGRGALQDVGGTNNLQNTTFSIHGGRTSDTRLQLDGVRLGNVLSPGEFSNFVPDTGATQETTVDYGAISAELAFGGLRINIVPKEGGNTYKGSFFATGVNGGWQSDNLTQDLVNRGLPAPNKMKLAYDINPSGGGPIMRDKLWFFASGRVQTNQNYIAGLFSNQNAGDPTKWTYLANLSDQAFFQITQKGIDGRVTWQASPRNKFSLYVDNQSRVWNDTRAGVSPESVVAYRFPTLRLIQAGWTSPVSSRLLLEARYANRGEAFGNQPDMSAPWNTLIPVFEQSNSLQYRGRGGDGGVSGLLGFSDQTIQTGLFSASYVTGAHAFKAGFSDTWADTKSTSQSNDYNLYYRFNNGVPNQITQYGTPTQRESLVKGELGAFVQDRWTISRLTLNLGARYDQFIGGYPVQTLGPAMWVPNRNLTFPAVTGINVKDVTVRVGESYDLFGNGKTALKVSVGKYPIGVSTIGDPSGIVNTITRTWTDSNKNFIPDCNLLNLQLNGECGVASSLAFGQPTSAAQFNNDTRFGYGNRAYDWEFSTSVVHQLTSRVGLDVGYYRRWFGNFQTVHNSVWTSANFDPFSITAPIDPRLPNGGGYAISQLYNIKPAFFATQGVNYTNMSRNLGEQLEHWNGVDISVNARVRSDLLFQGGISTGQTMTDNCAVLAAQVDALALAPVVPNASPVGVPYCHQLTNWMGQTQAKFLGTYLVPKIDINVAATFQSVPGPLISANYIASNAQIQQSLGRPLSGGAANVTVNLIAPGTMYGERANQLDWRFSRAFRFGNSRRVTANLDIYNLLNVSTVLQENSSYAVWRTPQRIIDGRLFKISGQVDF